MASEYDIELERLKRRRAVADAQLASSFQMPNQVQTRFLDLSPLANIAKAYFGGQEQQAVDAGEKDLAQRQREQVASALSNYQTAITPRASMSENIIDEQANGGEGAPATITAPAFMPTQQDKQTAALGLMSKIGGDPRDTAKLVVADALKGPKLSEINPKDYTPESFAAYTRTGDVTQLRAAQKPDAAPSPIKEYEYAKAQGYTGTFDEWSKEQKRAGATTVTMSTGKKYGDAFAGKVAEQDVGMLEAARKAPNLAERSNRVLSTLASGKVITGTGADYRLALGKALGLAGASDQETVSNTEALATDLAQNTLDAIKASGLGSGSGFSNADRDFLEKAVGGKITLEATTIKRLAELSHRAAEKSAAAWAARAKNIPDEALQGTGIMRDAINVPPIFTGGAKTGRQVSPETQKLLDKYAPVGAGG